MKQILCQCGEKLTIDYSYAERISKTVRDIAAPFFRFTCRSCGDVYDSEITEGRTKSLEDQSFL